MRKSSAKRIFDPYHYARTTMVQLPFKSLTRHVTWIQQLWHSPTTLYNELYSNIIPPIMKTVLQSHDWAILYFIHRQWQKSIFKIQIVSPFRLVTVRYYWISFSVCRPLFGPMRHIYSAAVSFMITDFGSIQQNWLRQIICPKPKIFHCQRFLYLKMEENGNLNQLATAKFKDTLKKKKRLLRPKSFEVRRWMQQSAEQRIQTQRQLIEHPK